MRDFCFFLRTHCQHVADFFTGVTFCDESWSFSFSCGFLGKICLPCLNSFFFFRFTKVRKRRRNNFMFLFITPSSEVSYKVDNFDISLA